MAEALDTGESQALLSAIVEWNAIGVRWCLLRDPGGPRDDFDILVDPRHFGRVRRSLTQAGFLERPAEFHRADAHFIHYGGETWTWVHLTTEISFGPYLVWKTGLEDLCLSRRVREGAWFRLHPRDEFWLLLLHSLLDQGGISGRYCERLPVLAAEPVSKSVFVMKLAQFLPREWDAERVGMFAAQRRFEELEKFGTALRRSLFSSASSRWLILRQKWRVISKVRQLVRRRGPVLAICAPNAEARSMAHAIAAGFVFPVQVLDCGSIRPLALRWAALRASLSGRVVLLVGYPGVGRLWDIMPVVYMSCSEAGDFDPVAGAWSEYRRKWASSGWVPR